MRINEQSWSKVNEQVATKSKPTDSIALETIDGQTECQIIIKSEKC